MPKTISLGQLIDTRVQYFSNLSQYLQRIERQEIPEAEKLAFLRDAIGYAETDEKLIREKTIPQLQKVVQQNLERYQLFKKLLAENSDASLCTFAKLVEYDLKLSRLMGKHNRKLQIEKEHRAKFSFNELNALEEIRELLHPLHPEIYKFIHEHILLKPIVEESKLHHLQSCTIYVEINCQWHLIDQKGYKQAQRLVAADQFADKIQARLVERLQMLGISPNNPVLDPDNAHAIMEAIKKYNAQLTTLTDESVMIRKNVDALIQLYPLTRFFDLSDEIVSEVIKEEVQLRKTNLEYANCRNIISLQLNEVSNQLTVLTTQFKKLHLKLATNDLLDGGFITATADISSLKIKLTELAAEWPEICPYNNLTFVEQHHQSSSKLLKSAKKQLSTLEKTLVVYQQSLDQKKQFDAQQKLAEEAAIAKRETEEFYARKALELADYKKSQQRLPLVRAPIATPAKKPEKITSNFKFNFGFAIALPKLSTHHFNTLSNIVNQTGVVKYHEVVNLFNQLGGTVEEIGNGSSHKRFSLKAHYLEMHTNAEIAQGATTSVVKPHGRAHNNGELSRFNIDMLYTLFTKLAITPTLLEKAQILEDQEQIPQNASPRK